MLFEVLNRNWMITDGHGQEILEIHIITFEND